MIVESLCSAPLKRSGFRNVLNLLLFMQTKILFYIVNGKFVNINKLCINLWVMQRDDK